MGSVYKLNRRGTKDKGIKIDIINTGVDYRHLALGAGFGPGHKIAGGYSFVYNNSTLGDRPILSSRVRVQDMGHMLIDSVPGSFGITRVVSETTIYIYRVFDCERHTGSNTSMAAMSKAYKDRVDIVSMSLNIDRASSSRAIDPLAAITETLTDAGVAVVVVQSNDANMIRKYVNDLFTEELPSTEPTLLSVGAT